jgi:K+-sensing histidine kinase KdpD
MRFGKKGEPRVKKGMGRRAQEKIPEAEIGQRLHRLDGELREASTELKRARREILIHTRRQAAAQVTFDSRLQRLREKVRLREGELSEKVKRLSILYEVGQALSAVLDPDRLLATIVRLAGRHLKARKASLMLIEEAGGPMKINAAVGIRRWIVDRTRTSVGEGIAGRVAATGESILIEDISRDRRFGRPSRGTYRTGSFLSVPLRRQERILGVLNVSDKRSREPFNSDDLNLVTTLAAQAAIAVENDTLYQSLREKVASLEELYRLREGERRQLFTLINSITDGILAVDLTGKLLFVNEQARSLLRLADGEERRTLREILPGDGAAGVILQGLDQALAAVTSRSEVTLGADWADRRHFEIVCLPVRESGGRMIGALTVLRDITELRELDLARDDFMNRASHQLKTPVGLIRGFADTLRRHPDLEAEKRRHFLDLVWSEAGRLADLVENLLDFTRIESKMIRVEPEQVNLETVLEEIMPAVEARGAERGVAVEISRDPSIPPLLTDPRCLREAMRNILDNSLKFTPRGGRIAVLALKAGEAVEIFIRNTGPAGH